MITFIGNLLDHGEALLICTLIDFWQILETQDRRLIIQTRLRSSTEHGWAVGLQVDISSSHGLHRIVLLLILLLESADEIRRWLPIDRLASVLHRIFAAFKLQRLGCNGRKGLDVSVGRRMVNL